MHYEPLRDASEPTNRIRRRVAASARLPAPLTVEAAVSAALCTLAERLTPGEAHALLAALPDGARAELDAFVRERDGKPTLRMDRAALVARVADILDVTPAHAELVCAAVYAAVRAELPAELVANVAGQLPHGLRELWLSPPIAAPSLDAAVPSDETRRALADDIERYVTLPRGVTGIDAFQAVMCTFARRLSGGEAEDVVLGLPRDLRPLVERCALHRAEHASVFGRDELLDEIRAHLGLDEGDVEGVVLGVLRATKRVLPQDVLETVASQLPADLREVWHRA